LCVRLPGQARSHGCGSTRKPPNLSWESKAVDNTAEIQNPPSLATNSSDTDWVHRWLRKVDEAQASQPHFVSPVVTTHVRLVQQCRYDLSWQQDPSAGTSTTNDGGSRGLEIIPLTRFEVGIFPRSDLAHQATARDGFGDFSFQVQFRAFSATEGRGDYFVGLFFVGSLPTAAPPNTIGHSVLSPTLAAAKGIGIFKAPSAQTFRPAARAPSAGPSFSRQRSITRLSAGSAE
jgi:hypothetical protein